MPYYHTKCGGEIRWFPFLPISPKCKKCGKKWSFLIQFGPPRKDMLFQAPKYKIKKGKTSYAPWADKIPLVGKFASWLPNWPRWARILATLLVIILVIVIVTWIID